MQEQKCVLVIDPELPLGLAANTAAILGVTLGKKIDQITGEDFMDRAGHVHQGITQVAMPILKNRDLNRLRETLKCHEPELLVVDLTDETHRQPTFQDYVNAVAATPVDELVYLGIAIYGPRQLVNRYTGNMALLR